MSTFQCTCSRTQLNYVYNDDFQILSQTISGIFQWMWSQTWVEMKFWIVWCMTILWGHQWVAYQLATPHETLADCACHFLKYCNLWMEILKKNAIKNHLRASLKLDTLDALMQVSLCGTKLESTNLGQYLNYSATWGIKKKFSLGLNIVRSWTLFTFI